MSTGEMSAQKSAAGHVNTIRAHTFDDKPFDIALSRDEIGRGATAKIYRGKIQGAEPRIVAVKDFGLVLDRVHEQLLFRELRAARKVRHPLILPFLGTVSLGHHQAIVSLYMKNGNLLDYLKLNPDADSRKLLLQVAEAVNYLHTVEELAHGDLKCANVLISDVGDALLADFGLSTFLKETATRTLTAIRSMNTVAFAAPELLLGLSSSNPSLLALSPTSSLAPSEPAPTIPSKSRESDVYAFGMLILEAVTGQVPFAGLNGMAVMLRICSRQLPSRPTEKISSAWWEVCRSCWTFNPDDRPAMQLVLQRLNASDLLPSVLIQSHEQIYLSELGKVFTVAYMPCGRRVVSCSEKAVQVLELKTGRSLIIDKDHPWNAAAAVCPIGSEIALATSDFSIQRWDALTGGPLGRPMQGHTDKIRCIAYSPDGNRIVSGSHDRTIRLWDASSGNAVGIPLEGHTSWVTSVAFSSDGRCIASASFDKTIRVWDSGSGDLLATLSGHSDWAASVCYLPNGRFVDSGSDGSYIVSGSYDKTIRIWDTTSERLVRVMEYSKPVFSVAVSPSGKYIASGSESTIRIWSAETGAPVGDPLTGNIEAVVSVAFSPDGKSIVSGSWDGSVRIGELFE